MCDSNESDFVPEDRFTGQLPESGWSNGAGSFHEGEHEYYTTWLGQCTKEENGVYYIFSLQSDMNYKAGFCFL